MKRGLLLLTIWFLTTAIAVAQVPGGSSIVIDKTPVVGGTNGQCLYINGTKVGKQACGSGTAADIKVGTTTVSSGTTTRVLYDNAGVLGEYTVSGTGTAVALTTSPTFGTSITAPLVIGGTAVGSSLSLQSTSAAGSGDFIRALVGNAGATEAWRTLSDGSLILGYTAAIATATVTPFVQIQRSNNQAPFAVYTWLTGTGGPVIGLAKGRSASIGTFTIVQNNDHLGSVGWYGADGVDFAQGAEINAFVDGTPGSNDMPTRIVLATAADGTQSPTARLMITSTGLVVYGATKANTVPALKPNSTALEFRLGDDSAYTSFTATTGILNGIASDATHTDATVCEDTTTHLLLFGSGTAGICLGTSSARFKEDVSDIRIDPRRCPAILAMREVQYRYKKGYGGEGIKYGYLAEEMQKVAPEVVGLDTKGLPNSIDYLGFQVLRNFCQQRMAQR